MRDRPDGKEPPALVEELGIIAGKGAYPRVLAESARRQGVRRLVAVAFRGETDPALSRYVDEIHWLAVGQLNALIETFRTAGIRLVVMAGQITPGNLFRLRLDRRALQVMSRLRERNAHTIFGAVCQELVDSGIELAQASLFMESALPEPGLLGGRSPTDDEQSDIALGLRVAKATSGLEIGQTVVVKKGTVLAVEAFEGTDAALLRAGKLGGAGAVVVKVARQGHDMRFDLPVVGDYTFRLLRRIRAAVLAVEARRTIVLDRPKLAALADRMRLCFLAVEGDGDSPAASTASQS